MKRTALALIAFALACQAQTASRHTILLNRTAHPVSHIQIADADGRNERRLVPGEEMEYSPSFSADGAWVVYTADRAGQADLYRVHPDGTGIQQLTNDPAFDDQGVLSPDGRTLAFVSTRGGGTANIWLMDLATGACTNLTRNHSGNFRPSWSPDGKWIAFTSDRDANAGVLPNHWELLQSTGVYIVHPDGRGLRRITRAGGVAGSPAWSADGRKVLFYETDEVGGYMAKYANARVEIVAIDVTDGRREQLTASNDTKLSPQWLPGGRIGYVVRSGGADEGLKTFYPRDRAVTTVVQGTVRNPSWSPDGRQVVFQRLSRLGSTRALAPLFSRNPEFQLLQSEPFPAFSADGSRLVFSQYNFAKPASAGVEMANAYDVSIEMLNRDGSAQRTLFYRKGYSAFSAAWSPAGDQLALSVGRYFRSPGAPPGQIALVKPDGSDFQLLVDDGLNNGFPSWSPDGKRLVFKRGHQLAILTLADRKITALTDGSHEDNLPQWSPTSDTILFTSDRDGQFDLYTIRPDGSQLRRLTTTPGQNAHAVWSSDGQWIVFSSGRMGFKDEMALYDAIPQPNGEIFIMRADGSEPRQLTDNKWEDGSPGWMPDSAAHSGEDLRPQTPRASGRPN